MRNSWYIYNQTNDLGCWRENNVTAHKKPENAPRCLYKYYFDESLIKDEHLNQQDQVSLKSKLLIYELRKWKKTQNSLN